jgi:phosphoglycolate phosphatase-like HAD superfamily hydrolase
VEKKEIIVFDFDGVVCDSTDECMVSAWNAWEKWEGRMGFRRKIDEFSDLEKDAFRKVRPYVRGAGEYFILKNAAAQNILLNGQEGFDQYSKKWAEFIDAFKKIFFESRNRLRGENLIAWIKLHPVFSEVIEILKGLNKQERLYIATLKDGESVRLILEHHGIKIPAEKLLDQSQIKSKLQALEKIRLMVNKPKEEIIFLDDNYTHLVEPFNAGYPVYLTSWGGALPEFAEMARTNGVKSANIHELTDLL